VSLSSLYEKKSFVGYVCRDKSQRERERREGEKRKGEREKG
jgi:hypothetical protein